MSPSRRRKSLRATLSEQGPLLLALVAIALLIAFTQNRKSRQSAANPAPTPAASPTPFVPSEPEPIPEEPPLGPMRLENAELPCDVDEVLAKKCRRCHSTPPRHGAPFPLFTWTDLQAPRSSKPLYEVVGRAVRTGFMPIPIPANPPVEPLTEAEKKTLLDWVDAGAPRGECKPTRSKKSRTPSEAPKGIRSN